MSATAARPRVSKALAKRLAVVATVRLFSVLKTGSIQTARSLQDVSHLVTAQRRARTDYV
jgi:hypothetical protein